MGHGMKYDNHEDQAYVIEITTFIRKQYNEAPKHP